MDAEGSLVAQAAMLKAGNPKQIIGIYRNIVKALPWFPSVAAKLRDPGYSGWFWPLEDATSKTSAPRCDTPSAPQKQLCSHLYHDQEQTPQYPPADIRNDSNCTSPGCDCGGVPCGEYLFNHRNASLRRWLIDEFILGDSAIGNENISVVHLDDNWQNYSEPRAGSPFGGPTEEDSHCIADMGLSQADVNAQTAAWEGTMQAVQDAVIEAGGWSWAWFLPVKTAPKGASAHALATSGPTTQGRMHARPSRCLWPTQCRGPAPTAPPTTPTHHPWRTWLRSCWCGESMPGLAQGGQVAMRTLRSMLASNETTGCPSTVLTQKSSLGCLQGGGPRRTSALTATPIKVR